MKKLEFTTGKGRFVVIDESELPKIDQLLIGKDDKFIKLSEITEEQAKDIVDDSIDMGFFNGEKLYKDYKNKSKEYDDYLESSLGSLHSLIKSKGWYLENPYKKPEHYDLWAKYGDFTQYGKSLTESVEQWQQAESRTLHNPVIFKINPDNIPAI